MDNDSRKVKVLFLSSYYYPHWTGIVQYARTLAEGLVLRGFRVKVWTIQHDKVLIKQETIRGVEVERSTAWWRFSRTWLSPSFVWGMGRQIKESDQVIVFLPMAEVLEAVVWAKIFRKRIYLIHNGDLKLTRELFNKIIELIFWISTYVAIRLCTGIIVNTIDYASNSDLLINNRDKWIEIIPPFRKLTTDSKTVNEIKEKLRKAKYVVGFAGRFVEEKGFDILLKAIPLVIKRLPGTKFVFAGETNIQYENTFQKNIQEWNAQADNLIVLGKVDHEKMGSFYKNCDVYVISSRSDFFPFTQAEAMIMGVPVVTTDIPGARRPVQVTGAGKIIKKDNFGDLALGIEEVIRNRKVYTDKYGGVKKYFNYNETMQKYVNLIGEVNGR